MAIRDLLYACVECGREAGIKKAQDGERCERCNTRYTRVKGARIRVERAEGQAEEKHAAEWLDLLEQRLPIEPPAPDRRERVILKVAQGDKPHFHRGIFLGNIEQFGLPIEGWFSLTGEDIRFEPDHGPTQTWPLRELTAVQPSSTSLQLKLRKGPVLALRFPEASSLLWEERVRNAVQALYTDTGRGRIDEYQPRIVCP